MMGFDPSSPRQPAACDFAEESVSENSTKCVGSDGNFSAERGSDYVGDSADGEFSRIDHDAGRSSVLNTKRPARGYYWRLRSRGPFPGLAALEIPERGTEGPCWPARTRKGFGLAWSNTGSPDRLSIG